MSFANSGDDKINPKEGNFDEFPAGVYTMIGIEDYFSKDDEDLPIFKPFDNGLRAHCHIKTKETLSQPPAWSGEAKDYLRLAQVLGADIEGLEAKADTKFLQQIQKRINAVNFETQFYAQSNGWVSRINALLPPNGFYKVRFVKAFSLDNSDPITFQEKENFFEPDNPNHVVRFMFEIISDVEDGLDYAGTTFVIEVHNPFDGVFNNLPSWKHAKNGGMLVGQRRLMTFLNIFWPDVEDYQWIVDPERSEYGINEAENPIHVIADKASQSDKLAITRVEVNDKGWFKMDLCDLSPCKSGVPVNVKPKTQEKPPWNEDNEPVKIHLTLIKVINDHAFGDIGENAINSTDGNPYNLTTKGGVWCKENVAPLWDKLGFDEPRRFDRLSKEQAKQLVDAIENKFKTNEF